MKKPRINAAYGFNGSYLEYRINGKLLSNEEIKDRLEDMIDALVEARKLVHRQEEAVSVTDIHEIRESIEQALEKAGVTEL